MIHIYCGDGKGKTTAACGLSARAAGAGRRVLFVQFFKDGSSSEIRSLEKLGIRTMHPRAHYGRYKTLSDEKKAETREICRELWSDAESKAPDHDLIVFDESVSAFRYGALDRDRVLEFLKREGKRREIVLTGRDPAPELCSLADYITEMKKIKHPFDAGIPAREGVEF
jgi:cob(I)alamin adenosyltransferase